MMLKIRDPNTFELLNVVTMYESVQWYTTFNTSDAWFQIDCGIELLDTLSPGKIVENSESEHIGVIKSSQTVRTNEKISLQVKGIMMEQEILSSRVISGIYTYMDVDPLSMIYNLIFYNALEPGEVKRTYPNIGTFIRPVAEEVPDLKNINYTTQYSSLSDEVFGLLQDRNLGFRVTFNDDYTKLNLWLYVGNDYTEGSENPIVFSRDRGTALSVTYTRDDSQFVTDLWLVGEDNTVVVIGREESEGSNRKEKSIDVASDIPWPVIVTEEPEGEGGQYYRYKKFSSPEFVSNMDIWEKYNVDRVETNETRYRDVERTTERDVSWADLSDKVPTIHGSLSSDRHLGPILSGVGSLTNAFNTNFSQGGTVIGGHLSPRSRAANEATPQKIVLGYLDNYNPDEWPAPTRKTTIEEARQLLDNKKSKTRNISFRSAKATPKKTTNHLGSVVGKPSMSVGDTGSSRFPTPNRPVGEVSAIQIGNVLESTITEIVTEEYTYTVVTYETRDFAEYVYVNPGAPPTKATKIIEGSVASGDVMYYENFKEDKVDRQIYKDAIQKKGADYLNTFVVSEAIEVEIYPFSNQQFKRDYKIGDIVTSKDKEIGFAVDERITQATEVWDSKGYTVTLTLGRPVPTLTNRIKMISKEGA